jgi:hypothetical protein
MTIGHVNAQSTPQNASGSFHRKGNDHLRRVRDGSITP